MQPAKNTHQGAFSPMNPSSPVYPDGLMHPGWIRKHSDISPAIVVGVYCIDSAASGDSTVVNGDLVERIQEHRCGFAAI